MKMFSNRFGSATMSVGIALFSGIIPVLAQTKAVHRVDIADFDQRTSIAKPVARLAEQNTGVNGLKQRLPDAQVTFDKLTDSPSFIRSRKGFLTEPTGPGLAAAASTSDTYRPVRTFIADNAALFGHGSEALENAAVTRDSMGAHNGMRTVVWQQQYAGLPVLDATLLANITKKGELVAIGSRFLPNVEAAAKGVIPASASVSASDALAAGFANLLQAADSGQITQAGETQGGYAKFIVRNRAAYSRLVWLPMDRSNLRLTWELYITHPQSSERFQLIVDAQSGAVLRRKNLTQHISDATYNVYTSDSPAPFSPGWPTPNPAQPPVVNRTLVTLPALDVTASPNGWINDGDNETLGNNTDTFLDRNLDGTPDGPRATGNPTRVFDFPLDLTQDPSTYSAASMVQMFYRVNYYHDRLYQLGFTESAGNYQQDNFGRGGLGNDAILAHVQAGADIGFSDNAFFSPAPDGISGEIAMFTWSFPTPDRDGDLDSEVIFHEATHGTSWRLVGGGFALGNLQGDGMGEGWSDFYALSLLSAPADDPDAAYPMVGYATYQLGGMPQNYYFGIRRYPYSTDLTKNPLTFKDIDPAQISPHAGVPLSPLYPFDPPSATEEHFQGEVWCVALWEVRANLIHKYGSAGNDLMLQLVTDGMKLTPASPGFLDARDAILLADEVNNGGVNTAEIWAGFAKRGMGMSASSPSSDSTTGVVEAFDVPGLQIHETILSGGNGNGVIDINECNQFAIVLKNNSAIPASGVSIRLATTTPGVAFGSKISNYPDVAVGATATNLVPFSISTSPNFVCGTPIVLDVLIKSDQVTSSSRLFLDTGTNGVPVRFDSTSPAAIPDLGSTNSIIVVSNITSAIRNVTVSLYLSHTFDSDLWIQLISPDGVTNTLSRGNGFSGNDYGASCTPDSFRTTFDDASVIPISSANPPFVGTFKPQEPLSVYLGKTGTNVNGNWQLRVTDELGLDIGTLNCWSIFLSPSQCADGGGSCPGSDLAIGMTDAPDPVFVGTNLVYTISVTNFGPNEAKNAVVTHQLPNSVLFLSAVSSQGSCVAASGLVTCNLGTLPFEGRATITITVLPTTIGVFSSTATISSSESDPDLENNSASTVIHVNPPTAELSLGLLDSPDPTVINGTVTYSVSVTNGGPSVASGVVVTNTLPLSANVQTASASQGVTSINGNVVVFNLGTLTNGGRATGTITVIPTAQGTISATSVVSANQADPIVANNSRTVTTVVGPASDLALGVIDTPDPVVVRSNWTYTIGVTNFGPSIASNVVVNASVPNGVTILSTNTTVGTISRTNNDVTTVIGPMSAGAVASITIVVNATNSGAYSLTATIISSASDPNSANNTASAVTTVAPPNVAIAAAGATLTAESIAPPNGTLDIGETVMVTLRLRNMGNVNNTNLVATLLATNGVTSPSGAQNYGILTPSDVPTGRPFTFTASGVAGGSVKPTLQLQDGPNNLGLVAFDFTLPSVRAFSNTTPIVISSPSAAANPPVAAAPYPSTILVSGVTGTVGKVTVTLSNMNHTFAPDVDVLLVGPSGQKVVLMSGAGNPNGISGANVTFDDAGSPLPADGQILSTSYAPADFAPDTTFPAPAPGGPYSTTLSSFNGIAANGTWSLYVADHQAGDDGSIAGGWKLAITTVTPVNQIADLGLSVVAAPSPNPAIVSGTVTYTFAVTNSGPKTASGIGFTNAVPPGAVLLSATVSQGSVFTNANTVVASIGTLELGGSATVTVVARAAAAGSFVNTGTVGASENDLNPANNTATASTSVSLPVADVAVIQAVAASAIIGSNVTFAVTVTNAGPQNALNVLVTDPLPAGMTFVSANSSVGTATNGSGTVFAALGNLASGGSATVTIVAHAGSLGSRTNTVTVGTASSDPVASNNSASGIFSVNNPAPNIVVAGATLVSESITPPDFTVSIGETVTVALALQNTGTANTTNLYGILQATGGVTAPSGAQQYAALVAGGPAVAKNFTFTAAGTNGGAVTATLLLDDQGPLGTVSFTFNLPTTKTFANTNPISIPDHGAASAYPSSIEVSGTTGLVSKVTVTFNGLTHGFPDDLDVLLVSPGGQKVAIMSDAGGGHAVTNITLSLDDSAGVLPDSGQIATGSYGPADYESGDSFLPPAPSNPAGSALSLFNGSDANGTWSLYVVDDSTGDGGSIAGGWGLSITTVTPTVSVADLAITMSDAPDPVYAGSQLIYTLTVTNRGPAAASGVVVSDNLPLGVTYASSLSSQGSIGAVGSLVTANIGDLAVGAGATLTIRTAPSIAGTYVNTASVTGGQSDLNLVNSTAQTSSTVKAPAVPTFTDVEVADGAVQVTLTGEPLLNYVISASTDLINWTPISTNTAPANGTIKFVDVNASSYQHRFYRATRLIP